jgi:selenoprotein W-related protein
VAKSPLPTIGIEYCLECCETLRALHEAEGILMQFEDRLQQVVLIPGGNGVFEVTVDDRLIFSKRRLGRHAEEGEVPRLVGEALAASPAQPIGHTATPG